MNHVYLPGLLVGLGFIALAVLIRLVDKPRDDDVDSYGDDMPTRLDKW